jgi:hypothetical protein
MAEAKDIVTGIQERLVAASEEKSRAERIEQAAQLAVRLAATVGSIESRLQKITDKLSDSQKRVQEAQAKMQRWIFAIAAVAALVILWMAAGQTALWWISWKGWRNVEEQ